MNFNHLVEKYDLMSDCVRGRHSYQPTGHVESMVGGNVAVRFRCKKCGKITTSILDSDTFYLHQNTLEKYITDKGLV